MLVSGFFAEYFLALSLKIGIGIIKEIYQIRLGDFFLFEVLGQKVNQLEWDQWIELS
jgi:hypothetical protein